MVHIDWDAGHGPVTGPLNAAGASLALAYAGHAIHLSPGWAAAAAGAGLMGSHIASRRRLSGGHLALRAATWVAAGGWCSWAIAEGPWTQSVIASLAAGAVGLGTAIAGVHRHDEKLADEKARAEAVERAASMDAKRRKIADEWGERLQRVCTGTRVQIVGVEQWDTGAGFTLDGECEGGTKWKDFKSYEDALAADAKLPEGCGVEVGPGQHRGAVLLRVSTVNALIDELPYPDDYSELSINEPVPFGVHRDGSPAEVNIRQLSALVAARRGAGKTNFMNVGLAQGNRMVDNIDWVIDLNGGGLALAWLHAWENAGRPGRPPIDWVADTPKKALQMAEAALAIAKARKPGYKKREIEANDDKLPVGPDVPAISIRCDEIAELFSPRARQNPTIKRTGDTLVQVMELARAVAVNEILAALRVTADVIGEPQILKQSGLRIGMQSDEAELAYLCGWGDKVSPQDIPYPGCGVMKVGDELARPFKAYRITPQQIAKVVVATADRHPVLDELSRKAAGEAYERRWENTEHLFGLTEAATPVLPAASQSEDSVYERPGRGSGITADWGTPSAAPAAPDAQSVIDQADAAKQRLHASMNEPVGADADLERRFQEIVEGSGGIWKPPALDGTPAPAASVTSDGRWPIVLSIVRNAGPDGISPDGIREAFQAVMPGQAAPSRSAITEWLKADPTITQPGGPRTNYIHRDHLRDQ